jgi:hypothetical protein
MPGSIDSMVVESKRPYGHNSLIGWWVEFEKVHHASIVE